MALLLIPVITLSPISCSSRHSDFGLTILVQVVPESQLREYALDL
jgi:hypothetical protein